MLGHWTSGVVDFWSCSTPTNLHSSRMRLNGRGFVSRSARFRSARIFSTSSRPSSLAVCSPRCLVCTCFNKSLTCCVVHQPLVVACNCHTHECPEDSEPTLESRDLLSAPLSHRSVQLTFPRRQRHRLLDQNLKGPPLWTSISPLTESLSSRFAAAVCHDVV